MENFLTCRALAAHLKENIFDETAGKFFEEAALNAIYKTISSTVIVIPDFHLLMSELPNLLQLRYPVVKNILKLSLNLIKQSKDLSLQNSLLAYYKFQKYYEIEYIEKLLQSFDNL